MTSAIAWIDGQWGTAANLNLPLDDRALLLADGLFETVLVRNSQPQLLQEHLLRWSESAALLGMGCTTAARQAGATDSRGYSTQPAERSRWSPAPQLEPGQHTSARNRTAGPRAPPLLAHASGLHTNIFSHHHHHQSP